MRPFRVLLLVVLLAMAVLQSPPAGASSVSDPTVTGPIGTAGIHGHALWDSWFDLDEVGYTEDEYFISGTARHNTDPAAAPAPFTTRIIVTRPTKAGDFNGSVLMEWTNVTAQFENAVDIVEGHEYLLRDGWAYVHVSAQAAGICCTPLTPKTWDPQRYGSLNHPGDDYANDMFSQVAKALRSPTTVDPMSGLTVERLIAAGQSQSASRLYSYVNQEQSRAGLIDGFLIHGGGSKTYGAPPAAPVLHLLSDREATPVEPNQTTNYRLWEVAGTAHSDFWIGYHQVAGQGPRFAAGVKRPASADEELHLVAGNYGEQPHPLHGACIVAGGAMPMRYSVSAGLEHLDSWVAGGAPPPAAPRYEFEGTTLAKDEHGNARGGIRLPPVDVPVARYESNSCQLGGVTIPFTEAQLQQLYPTHAEYYAQMRERTEAAAAAGFLLEEDAKDLLTRACAAKNRWLEPAGPCKSKGGKPKPRG